MASSSRPPSPPLRSDSPSMIGYFSSPFEKFIRDDTYQDWNSAFTLLGTHLYSPGDPGL